MYSGIKVFNCTVKEIVLFVFIAVLLTSCAKIPSYPEVPKEMDQSQMAEIKLITMNEKGFNEQFGGTDFELHFLLIPHWRDEAGISFNQEYMVKVEGDWETSNGKFFSRRYKFNDKAVFKVPSGEYNVCAHKLLRSSTMKRCYKNDKFKFEPGKKYEMYIYYRTERNTVAVHNGYRTTYTWYLGITGIREVEQFKPTQMF